MRIIIHHYRITLITFLRPGIVAESAMNLSASSCLLFLSAMMWSREPFLPLFTVAELGFGCSELRFRWRFLEERVEVDDDLEVSKWGVGGIMVEVSKDKIYVLGEESAMWDFWGGILTLEAATIVSVSSEDKLLPSVGVAELWWLWVSEQKPGSPRMSLRNSSSSVWHSSNTRSLHPSSPFSYNKTMVSNVGETW